MEVKELGKELGILSQAIEIRLKPPIRANLEALHMRSVGVWG